LSLHHKISCEKST